MKTKTQNWNRAVQSVLAAACLIAAGTASAQNGTWTNLMSNGSASGSWSAATNWLNSVIAGGTDSTADFSTLNLTTNSTVTLDGARTIGKMIFGSTTSVLTNNWILATGTGGPLTLAVSSGQPTLTANNGSNAIAAVLLNTALPSGITKTGNGLIRLSSANLMTNAINNVNAGILQIGNNNALGYTNTVNGLVVGTNIVASGATLYVAAGVQGISQQLYLSGAGYGGTNGALRADAGNGNQQNTRWSYALNSLVTPAIILGGDTTIRVDGSGYTTQAGVLVGAITNNASTNVTLTVMGMGELRVDPGVPISVANIHVASGVLGVNSTGNNGISGATTVTVDSGAVLAGRRNRSVNSSSVVLALNGILDLNYNTGATVNNAANSFSDVVGSLSGNGLITNSYSAAPQTLYVSSGTSNSIFGGTIATGVTNGPIVLNKQGQATTMWLTGSCAFNGTNIVAGGVEYIDGAWNPTNGGFVVGPQSGATTATLAGNGSTRSPISLASGGYVSAGDPTIASGTLTVSNSISGSGSVIISNANLNVSGTIGSPSSYLTSVYLTNGTLKVPLLGSGPSVYASTFTVDGAATIVYSSANPSVGQFPLIAYSSLDGLAGGDTNGITLVTPAGTSAYLSNNVNNSSLDVVVLSTPALVWQGTPDGNWTIGGSADWLNGATAAAYTETAGSGPSVIFNDFAPGTTWVNVSTTVTPAGITVISTNLNYTFSGSGSINGSGSFIKDGPGTLTLANTNTFSGVITVLNGALAIGNGGTAGSLGTASVANSGEVIFNRSDNVTIANAISGSGSLVKNNTDAVTLTGVGNVGGTIVANAGTLALGPSGTITVSGDVTGNGAFGINGSGSVILSSGNITYSGGSLINVGTLEFDNAFPPSGNILDNGTLAFGVGGTFSDNISGTGGLTLLNGASVTLGGANSYTGPTTVLAGSSLTTDDVNYPPASILVLGNTNGTADVGSVTFNSGNPVLGGLAAGGNSSSPGDPITFNSSGQTLTINGNVYVGNSSSGASVYLPVTGSGVSLTVNTNGGVVQIGLGTYGSGINPDNVLVDFSGIDNFTAYLGTSGVLNLGTLDGNPGPPSGATVVNQLKLANLSNSITAGTLMVGAGGRQLVPELMLGPGTNVINANTNYAGGGGRDGSYIHFAGSTGGLRLRASDGVSRAILNEGVNPGTGTGASITNTVDFTGHWVDFLVSTLVIGDYNNAGFYENTFSFDTGILDAQSTSLSVLRNNNANAATSGSILNINGGTASLGPVVLTASAAFGTLNISGATVTTANITAPGAGVSTLSIANSTWNLALTNNGSPATAPVVAQALSLTGTVNLAVGGTNWLVGKFPLISYTGSIGGDGYTALNLVSLPAGVSGYLSNDVANLAVDMVVTNAPAVITVNTNPVPIAFSIAGNTLNLSWPPDHLGWRLMAQTNALGAGLNPATNAWFTVSGSAAVTNETFTINPANSTVFYRLAYP